jgi:osmotically-inducible protein OsmY
MDGFAPRPTASTTMLAIPEVPAESLADRVVFALEQNPHVPGRRLRLETVGSRVVLQGIVKTYFEKQMAQETVRHVKGVEQVENCLEVTWG